MIFAGERVGAHERPVDIGRYLGEESFGVAFAEVVEELGNLAFVWVFGGGYGLVSRAVFFWRGDCESWDGCGSDQEDLERGIHYEIWAVEEWGLDVDSIEMEVPSLNRSYTGVGRCIERSSRCAGK